MPAQLTVATLGRRLPWREALERLACFARALAEHERQRANLGPLLPEDLILEPESRLNVDALEGPTNARLAPPRFTPPEQASGAPWDAAARRYVLGLAAYKMIAGALPFAGEGLRRDLAERSSRGVPPFEDSVARELRPGVQAFVLRLLAPRAADRPRSALEIARECEALLEEQPASKRPKRAARAPAVSDAAPARRSTTTKPRSRWGRERLVAMALVAAGGLVAAIGAFAEPSKPKLAPSLTARTQSS